MPSRLNAVALCLAASLAAVSGQTFQRLGTCPTLGCVLPPDQQDFLPGQQFDIRFEVHAPTNGSEAFNGGVPDDKFTATITKEGQPAKSIAEFFKLSEPALEKWTFSWFEDLFAQDAKNASVVNVASKIYRRVALYEPGNYNVTLTYYSGRTTTAQWVVRPLAAKKKAKNVIFFIGDGMTTNMITAARLLAHKTVNGKYQTLLALDKFPVLGHQMTHSIDSFITDSANSASALYSGHKSTVNAMGVYADSSPDLFDDPKVETIVELLTRIWGSAWGAVSTAFIADATPIALTAHTRSRYQYGSLIDQALYGVTNYSWTKMNGPDAYFGGGAEQFLAGSGSYLGKDYYAEFAKKNYSISLNKTSLLAAPNNTKALGIFCKSNLPVWLDRNIFPENIKKLTNDPSGAKAAATDLPGLKEMTLKAIDVLHERGGKKGFFLMSEAASVDKQMHVLDYDRALGDLLELDDTVQATIKKLKALGILEETLIVVSADHGHGFDVFGNADTKYLAAQQDDRQKRNAVGVYQNSGLSQYTVEKPGVSYGTGANFPVNWDPRYVIAAGLGANPDHREAYGVAKNGSRVPAAAISGGASSDYYVNPTDKPNGFIVNGTLPTNEAQGVHSLTDVPVFARGPCQDTFGGVYSNIDVFYKIANCLGLAQPTNKTASA
ncbi:alkaline phosphatase [Lasiosphaeria miniovina]|uniref:alkaline phosphatase n=1 Tax=Lasiosphaeria miniovina TaxID=1954250 RepID=A0AA40E7P9_9PEZI|nr:alkaline phosphatase [Lasiosphaeria miniovina]KAK0728152.1 alkaline phosphatase [Lasiosphaeria miniovina]